MAKFCQKYMAQEMLAQQHYRDGDVAQSLIRAFHRMDDMLRDTQYHEEVRVKPCEKPPYPRRPSTLNHPALLQDAH